MTLGLWLIYHMEIWFYDKKVKADQVKPFVPVDKATTMRTITVLAAQCHWLKRQVDVISAF